MFTNITPSSHAPQSAPLRGAQGAASVIVASRASKLAREAQRRLFTRGAAAIALVLSGSMSAAAHASEGHVAAGTDSAALGVASALTTVVSLVTVCIRDGAQWLVGMVDALLDAMSLSLLADVPAATPADAFIARAPDLAALALVAAIAFAFMRSRQIGEARRLEVAARMIEKGIEPPASLMGQDEHADLRRGLVLSSLGLGLVLAAWMTGKAEASPLGLIPGFIGLGYLLSHRLTRADRGQA